MNNLDFEQFNEYLLSIGFNQHGASELIDRVKNERPDRDDLVILEHYQDSIK